MLGIEWNDDAKALALAKESLFHSKEILAQFSMHHDDYKLKAKMELFGLAAVMMQIMTDSADEGFHTCGGVAWKAFFRVLIHETWVFVGTSNGT